jgi:hypothetical protein
MTRSVPKLTLNFIKAAVVFFSRAGRAHDLSRSPISPHPDLRWLLLGYGHITAQARTRPNDCSKSSANSSSSTPPRILCL